MTDKIDEAISRTAGAPPSIELEQNNLTIDSTGRPFVFLAPADLTIDEIDEICAWMLTALRGRQVARAREAAIPSIEVARAMPRRPQ